MAGLLSCLTTALAGCGASAPTATSGQVPAASGQLPADYRPVPAGRSAAYRLPAVSPAVARRAAISGLRCTNVTGVSYGIHLELYAHRLVLPVPAGIGVAPPQRRAGAYVRSGACTYPLRTSEPTGVVIVGRAAVSGARPGVPSLGTLFAVWGQPLSSSRLAGFRGTVRAFVQGRLWRDPPARIPLTRHAEIVLEVGGAVPPHPAYLFPAGL